MLPPPEFERETYVPTILSAGPHGTLRGAEIVAADGHVKARRFCQIPFAHPPVGDRRWRKPEPLGEDWDWSGVEGEEFGPMCAQPSYVGKGPNGEETPLGLPGHPMSEDALTVNVWTPAAPPAPEGWPVLVNLHGGWLQIGHPSMTRESSPADFIDQICQAVVVAPAYRLCLFGFLSSKEIRDENEDGTAGNFGFWDQRLAIEWTAQNARLFGGNPSNITICGLSAGAHSVQAQLGHELDFPESTKPIIARAVMWSNALPAQPKTVEESQAAFDGLLEAFDIPLSTTGPEKMARLRALSTDELVDKIMKLKIHTFRAVTDGSFIHPNMYTHTRDGTFARAFADRNLALVIGEVSHEEYLYGATNPPRTATALPTELENYYPPKLVDQLLTLEQWRVPPTIGDTPEGQKRLQLIFGDMVAHGQVYVPTRALARNLVEHGVKPGRVLRYRVSWRPGAEGREMWGPGIVTHADDVPLWWFIQNLSWTNNDTSATREWLAPYAAFVRGDVDAAATEWYSHNPTPADVQHQREIRGGSVRVREDDRWNACETVVRRTEG